MKRFRKQSKTKITIRLKTRNKPRAIASKASRPPTLEAFNQSELVIGFVGAVGVELDKAEAAVTERLKAIGYTVETIHITKEVIPQIVPGNIITCSTEYFRIKNMMDAGNEAREKSSNNAILALGVAQVISKRRQKAATPHRRTAYIVHSLKHPDEVRQLREIYPRGFYTIGVHAPRERKLKYLTEVKRMSDKQANSLMGRDMNENLPHGQRIIDTFHLSDFFVRLEVNNDRLKNSLWRIVDILFSNPHLTPTFGEYAMFLAFSASLRSADLSRQVGAVIARDGEILATGANDCPRPGGGLYWPEFDSKLQAIVDVEGGRDWTRGGDANKEFQKLMIEDIINACSLKKIKAGAVRKVLEESSIRDLTEFGRVVHAEMEALISCGRNRTDTRGATMYCTTFPCHNCAKHIVAAGISRVVFVEPYSKSKATVLFKDAIKIGSAEDIEADDRKRPKFVIFEPFVGVGPRRFFDLFSMHNGVGNPLIRRDKNGKTAKWQPETAHLRIQMLPWSYLELENQVTQIFDAACL